MQNTNTTYFLSKQSRSLCPLNEFQADTFEIRSSQAPSLPATYLRKNENLWGDFIYTILFLIIYAFIRLRGKDLLSNLLHILIKRKKSEIILNEGIASNLVCYILALALSFSAISIGITFITWNVFFSSSTFYIFTGLFFYHFFLLLLIRILGWTFNSTGTADEFIVNLWTYNIFLGLFISPFIISIFFVQAFAVIPLLKIVIFSSLIFIIVKIIREVEILFSHRVSILYMFLYLCGFEIMPLLVLYKMVA